MYLRLHPYPVHIFPTNSYGSRYKHMKKLTFDRFHVIRKGGILEQYSSTVALGNILHMSKSVGNFIVKLRPYVYATSSTMKP